MSGLAYDVPDGGETGPSSAGQLGTVRGDFNPNWNHPHGAGGPVDDFYPSPRVYPELALAVPC